MRTAGNWNTKTLIVQCIWANWRRRVRRIIELFLIVCCILKETYAHCLLLFYWIFFNSLIADTYALILRIEENTTKIMKQTMGKWSFDERKKKRKIVPWMKCIDGKKASNNNFEAHHRLGSIEVYSEIIVHTTHISHQISAIQEKSNTKGSFLELMD